MNERNLSRRLSTSIVDALKAHGHILVARGGATALARELEDKMSADIAIIAPRLEPWAIVDGEVTTTFGTDEIDDQVEELVASLTSTLMESEHVEDIFTEDNVIKRDVFRVMRDALLGPRPESVDEDDGGPVQVRLDMLGYVASTVGKRAPVEVLREALARAAASAGGKMTAYDPELREATFAVEGNDPDARLELEEAVADELSDLVEARVVTLPTMERRLDLPRKVDVGARGGLRQRLDAIASRMLRDGGCAASWELAGDRSLRLKLTPLSEQDALEVESHMTSFTRDIASLLGESPDALVAAGGPASTPLRGDAPVSRRRESAPPVEEDEDDLDDEDDLEDEDLDEGEGDLDDEDEDDLDEDEDDLDEDEDEDDLDEDEDDLDEDEQDVAEENDAPDGKPAARAKPRIPSEPAEERAPASKAKGKVAAERDVKKEPAKKTATAARKAPASVRKVPAAAAAATKKAPASAEAAARKAPASAAEKKASPEKAAAGAAKKAAKAPAKKASPAAAKKAAKAPAKKAAAKKR
ncbi:uncharacterized protein SOCE26_046510 [Sorangium cellulosum]|uniref:Uncharacterized protein n=1 Tax=Sorangium cellulosum TaxID=56 RepID=A0A2L0EV80_SORCE|nr:hypothetical protein [Sorangium cellulosum]AUX43207.1 uncharacterized protein SOCE26_046510 [Sorangium cellulosum]